MTEPNRRSLYISKAVWGELKHRAFLENKTAGSLIAYLLEYAVNNPETVPDLERYQSRSRNIGDDRARRTARGIPDALWDQAEKLAHQRGTVYSVSGLVEYLLHNYLGMNNEEEETTLDGNAGEDEFQPDIGLLRTGKTTFNLGKDAKEIDLRPSSQ